MLIGVTHTLGETPLEIVLFFHFYYLLFSVRPISLWVSSQAPWQVAEHPTGTNTLGLDRDSSWFNYL